MKHKSGLFLLFGAWLSFIGLLVGGSLIVPITTSVRALSPAAIYRTAVSEELREATTLPLLGKVIAINQTGMKLSLYQDGVSTKTFRISSLAEPHSMFEVPSGSYAIGGKEPQHLSRESALWMPHALSFGDNYFIHGMPRTLTKEQSSEQRGVSIALSTIDAKEVYDFASIGAKVIVTGGSPRSLFASTSRYYLGGGGKPPTVSAPAFIVADINTRDVLWQRAADIPRVQGKLASFTTALTAVETLDQYKNVRIGELLLSGKAAKPGPPSRDDELPLGSLIYPLLFDANETASEALLEELGSKTFVGYMNNRALLLQMGNTHFTATPTINESTTSAQDLFKLFSYIYTSEHFLLDVSLSKEHAIFASSGAARYNWENKNPWVIRGERDYDGGLGVLSQGGAGGGMFLFKIPFAEFGERTIAFVILDSSDIEGDIARMKAFVREHYSYGVRREEQLATTETQKKFMDSLKGLLREEIIYEKEI